MEREEIFSKLKEIFEDVLDLEGRVDLRDETNSDDIEEWDSLSHIQLIVAIEKAFKVKFTAGELLQWKNVGEMVTSIESKIK
jgi:acyl carrier protein